MKTKKEVIERFKSKGGLDRLNKILSAAHLLALEQNNLMMEAGDLCEDNGLLLGEIKMMRNRFEKEASRYFHSFGDLIDSDKVKLDMWGDLDDFDKSFRQWAKIDNESLQVESETV